MKKLLTCLIVLFTFCSVFSQEITGTWQGKLDLGSNKLSIVFHFNKAATNYTATMDSPNQNAKGIAVSTVDYINPNLTIKIDVLKVDFNGEVVGDTLIRGTFNQGGYSFPLSLKRGDIKVNRPQEPTPPYPYSSTDVLFLSQDQNVTLAGTLTLPAEGNGLPAVLLISGSGPQNRNEEILGHKPFLVLADYLTRQGIAVLRYDDRGVNKSGGNYQTATFADFVKDAIGAYNYLCTNERIDKNKIGIIGHSEGSSIAFMCASQNPHIAFVVSMAGASVKGDSVLLIQNRDLMLAKGVPEPIVDSYVGLLRSVFEVIETGDREFITENSDSIIRTMIEHRKPELPESWQKNAIDILKQSPDWLKAFLIQDAEKYIKQTRCPVLAINGLKDLQVNAEINLQLFERLKPKANVKVIRYDGLNHLFQHCNSGLPEEYGQIEETMSTQVLKDISDWIMSISLK